MMAHGGHAERTALCRTTPVLVRRGAAVGLLLLLLLLR